MKNYNYFFIIFIILLINKCINAFYNSKTSSVKELNEKEFKNILVIILYYYYYIIIYIYYHYNHNYYYYYYYYIYIFNLLILY